MAALTKLVSITLSFGSITKLKKLCKYMKTSQSRLIEDLIAEKYYKLEYGEGVIWSSVDIESNKEDG